LLAYRTGVEGGPARVPEAAGQQSRFMETLNRATLTQSMQHHGYGETAEHTAQMINEAGKAASDKAFGAAYTAGARVNLQKNKQVQKVVDNLLTQANDPSLPEARRAAMTAVLKQMAPNGKVPSSLQLFEDGRQLAGDLIQAKRVASGNTARIEMNAMAEAKSQITAAVYGVKDRGLGKLYQRALEQHAGDKELVNQLKLGEELRAGKAGIDDYLAYAGDRVAQSRIRHGYNGAVSQELAEMGPGADVTRLFNKTKDRRMIRAILDNTRVAGSPVDKADRFFANLQMLGREKTSRQVAFGGSQTAANIQYDKMADTLHRLRDIFQGGPVTSTSRAAQYIYQSAFGKDRNVAAAMVDMMTSADPIRNKQTMNNIIMRMGRNPFLQALDKLEAGIARHGQKTISAVPGARGVAAEEK
jgi:hypothetical protein